MRLVKDYVARRRVAVEHSTFVVDAATRACRDAGVYPESHHQLLMELILAECREAYREMRRDAIKGGPTGLIASRYCQHIYLADAGRRAGDELVRQLKMSAISETQDLDGYGAGELPVEAAGACDSKP